MCAEQLCCECEGSDHCCDCLIYVQTYADESPKREARSEVLVLLFLLNISLIVIQRRGVALSSS